ncbi:MAG: protein translocase subunit SecD [candidate division NC10 bacterium]|nr:protein translocase subunit SecD [candidate division NC10 bacterium]
MKREIKWRVLLLAGTAALSLLYILPSLPGFDAFPSWWRRYFPHEKLNLGLDLRGGMHLVLEVQTDKAVENATERLAAEIRRVMEKEKVAFEQVSREGIDRIRIRLKDPAQRQAAEKLLADYRELERPGGTVEEILVAMGSGRSKEVRGLAVSQTLETIRNRVDQFGVAEPHIVPEGERRIVVQLPGIREPERAIKLIGQTALLEFKLLDEEDYERKLSEALQGKVPEGDQVLYQRVLDEKGNVARRVPYLVRKQAMLTGDVLTSARAQVDSEVPGRFQVGLEFDREGARIFSEVTGANVGRRLAIILDDNVYSAPVIQTKIPDGRARITGNFDEKEASLLAIVLRAGALPAPVDIIANLTVGPSLGQDSIEKGIQATILGGLLVILFMAVYYKFSGLIADFALFLNLILMMGALALLRATLTLPGIAGIVLSMGMAVDSNVLMFERIREELRLGKTVRSAIDAGYDKAFWTIWDSHVTTLITALALFLFGTGPIKGFAVTLSMGVTFNLFTALVGTKTVFDWMIRRWEIKRLSI